MSTLESIAVRAETVTGNVEPLLHEVRHSLERLLRSGEPTSIDLNSLPIAPSELEALATALGPGEISAELQAFGHSAIRETGTAGVWIVEHFNSDGEPMAKHLEITHVPEILRSQRVDVASGLRRLEQRLDGVRSAPRADSTPSPMTER